MGLLLFYCEVAEIDECRSQAAVSTGSRLMEASNSK